MPSATSLLVELAWECVKHAGGHFIFEQVKDAIGSTRKWESDDLANAFAAAWQEAVCATRREYLAAFSAQLSNSMAEAIWEATSALARADFMTGWIHTAAGTAGFKLSGEDIGNGWDDDLSARARSLTSLFRKHLGALSPTLQHIPDSFFGYWQATFLHKLLRLFMVAIVRNPQAAAQINLQIQLSHCRRLALLDDRFKALDALAEPLAEIAAERERQAAEPRRFAGLWHYALENHVSGARVIGAFEIVLRDNQLAIERGVALYALTPPDRKSTRLNSS